MAADIIYKAAAEAEISDVYQHYEAERQGLGINASHDHARNC